MFGAVHGFPVRIFMSELCSVERFQILNAFGASVMLTTAAEHTRGARARAIAWCEQSGGKSWFVNQHSNPNNGDAHYATTGPEIWAQTEGKLDTMIIGLGTSGTFEGLSRFFKETAPHVQIVAFEPAAVRQGWSDGQAPWWGSVRASSPTTSSAGATASTSSSRCPTRWPLT